MAKVFPSKFSSTCKTCKQKWEMGDLITRSADGTHWKHEVCPNSEIALQKSEGTYVEGLKPESVANETISIPETPVDIDIENFPELSEIEKSIADATEKIASLETEVEPLRFQYKTYADAERAILEETQERIETLRKKQAAVEAKGNIVKYGIQDLQDKLEKLAKQKRDLLKVAAAKQRLSELETRLTKIFKQFAWAEHMKDFQKEDILFTVNAFDEGKSGVLNANIMGSGKTFEAVASIDAIDQMFYAKFGRLPLKLWLTKKSLMHPTFKEVRTWNADRLAVTIEGNPQDREIRAGLAIQNNMMVIANYESLQTTPILMNTEWDILIVDEVHHLKGGPDVKKWINTKKVSENVKFMIFLSGTPVVNKAADVWAYLHLFNPDKFRSLRLFEKEFLSWDGGIKTELLAKTLQGQFIRQDPELITASWPDAREIVYELEHYESTQEVYNQARQGFITQFKKLTADDPGKSISISAIIAMLTYCREINLWPEGVVIKEADGTRIPVDCDESVKVDTCLDKIEELLADGEQSVIWSSQFNAPLFEIQKRVQELGAVCEIVKGQTDVQDLANKFQQGEINVLACNRMAGGEGLNLQKNPNRWPGGASHAIFLDRWWNPAGNEQMEQRIWREGAAEDCTYHVLYIPDSVDALIAEINQYKAGVIDSTIEREELRPAKAWLDMIEDLV